MPSITIPSSPTTFTLNGPSVVVTFPIPAGFVATAGQYDIVSNVTTSSGFYHDVFTTTSSSVNSNPQLGIGVYNYTLIGPNLSDVNAAAGGNLSVTCAVSGTANQNVTSFTITLTGTYTSIHLPDPMWGTGFQAPTPNTGVGLGTPCGALGISNSGPNASPASLTITQDFTGSYSSGGFSMAISYAGQHLSFAVDSSPNGTVWANLFSGTIGSDHLGSFTEETISYTFPSTVTDQFVRVSIQEVPQPAASSLVTLFSMMLVDSMINPITVGSGYCGGNGTLTLTGTLTYGTHLIPGHGRENFPLTLFVKMCCLPTLQPCAHIPVPPGTVDPSYCHDGQIQALHGSTDCNGNYSFTVSGCILQFGLALGTWIPNPDLDCAALAPGLGNITSQNWLAFIPDTQTQKWIDSCGGLLTIDGFATGAALTIGSLEPSATGSLSERCPSGESVYTCGFADPFGFCFSCITCIGCVYVSHYSSGSFVDGQLVMNGISGSYDLNMWNGSGPRIFCFFIKDGQYYEVIGIYTTLTDTCGHVASHTGDTGFDWTQFASCSISNWTPDCNPPILTHFTGPDGGDLFVLAPTAVPRLGIQSMIYPTYDGKIPSLCPLGSPVLGVQIQPPCTGIVPDRLQADVLHDNLALSWVTSGSALKTSVNRSASIKPLYALTGNFETPYVVEATNADDIGMVFLPNESLYLTYLLSGVAKYRLNKQFGTTGQWGTIQTPAPLVARHSASGRGQEQAFRFRALGTQSTDGPIEFSQCRDNQGVNWTAPVTVTSFAQGPYCGGIYTGNKYVCMFSLSPSTTHGIPGGLYTSTSVDGGVTWGAPVFTGLGGQCNGIIRVKQETLLAVIWDNGTHGSTWVGSYNGGTGWGSFFQYGFSVPSLTQPPVIATDGDNIFVCWVTGDVPQYIMSTDGGHSFY
jgi:hypothetical protein